MAAVEARPLQEQPAAGLAAAYNTDNTPRSSDNPHTPHTGPVLRHNTAHTAPYSPVFLALLLHHLSPAHLPCQEPRVHPGRSLRRWMVVVAVERVGSRLVVGGAGMRSVSCSGSCLLLRLLRGGRRRGSVEWRNRGRRHSRGSGRGWVEICALRIAPGRM